MFEFNKIGFCQICNSNGKIIRINTKSSLIFDNQETTRDIKLCENCVSTLNSALEIEKRERLYIILHEGYDAGNYDSCYYSEYFSYQTRCEEKSRLENYKAYDAAYIIGFFSSYEMHEIPYEWLNAYKDAIHFYKQEMINAGISWRS